MNERAVSTVLGYTLTLGISSLLIIGLLVATGGFANDHRQETIRDELQVIGQQVASDLSAADRLVRTGGDAVSIHRQFPAEVTGIDYQLEVQTSPTEEVVLSTDDPEITVTIPLTVRTSLGSTTVKGGEIVIEYTGSQLEVQDA